MLRGTDISTQLMSRLIRDEYPAHIAKPPAVFLVSLLQMIGCLEVQIITYWCTVVVRVGEHGMWNTAYKFGFETFFCFE